MKLKELTDCLYELFEEKDFKKIIEILIKALKPNSKRLDNCRLFSMRLSRWQDREIGNAIDIKDSDVMLNKIGQDLLSFISLLKQVDLRSISIKKLKETTSTHDEIFDPILVFTSVEGIPSMKQFFNQLNFANVSVLSYDDLNYNLDEVDLVIFDNQDLPFCNNRDAFGKIQKEKPAIYALIGNRLDKMNKILTTSKKLIIHFGDILFWVSENRSRVQGANSKFTLHARTKEVIEFVNTYYGNE